MARKVPHDEFKCYNCGELNDHYSRNCPLDQENTRCPTCHNVAFAASSHKILCKQFKFRSVRIGSYELPLMDYQTLRFTFKNVEQIYCSDKDNEDDLITKFFSIGTNIKVRRIYTSTNETIIDLKVKPTVSVGLGRKNGGFLASLMLCDNQVRMNHYYHIDSMGNVSFNVKKSPRIDTQHDIAFKLDTPANVILFSLDWNNKWQSNIAMSSNAVSIR